MRNICTGITLLCRLSSIVTVSHRDHFFLRLSVCPSLCLSGSHTFLVVTHSYVSQTTHVFLGMLPLFKGFYLWEVNWCCDRFGNYVKLQNPPTSCVQLSVYFRCTGCEAMLQGIETQIAKANQNKENNIKMKNQIEQEVFHPYYLKY